MTVQELLARYAAGERNFSFANLSNADLGGADLGGAYLRGAYLGGANLTNCTILGLKIGVATITLFNKICGRQSYCIHDDIGNKIVVCGCWLSTLEDFEKRCKEVYPKDPKAAYEEQILQLKKL